MVVGQLFKKTILIVPARKNSKGIEGKNKYIINGFPLIYYTLKFIIESKLIQNTIISTDSEEIMKIANDYGFKKNKLRPSSLSSDNSSIIDVILYELKKYNYKKFENILLLQPTAPLRKIQHLIDINEIYNNNIDLNSIVSLVKLEEPHPYKIKKIVDNKIKSFLNNKKSEVSRQILPDCYSLNGSYYFSKISSFLKYKSFFNNNTIPYIMNKNDSINIDEPNDILILKKKIKTFYR